MVHLDVHAAMGALEAFVEAEAPGFATNRALAERAAAVSVGYTQTRSIDHDAAASVAYLAHFGPRAVAAVGRALAALPAVGSVAELDHVVDVGAGSGASALAWAVAGAKRLTLIDRSASALQLARRLLAAAAPHCRVEVQKASFEAMSTFPEASHVSAAFVVGELSLGADDEDGGGDVARALAAFERLAPRARAVVVVDAGDRPRARRLQRLRGAVLDDGGAIYGPCGHTDACPALVRERDWCHDRIDKQLPSRLAAFSALVGRDPHVMSASWLTYGRVGADHGEHGVNDEDDGGVIVTLGNPRVEKGRVRLPVCGPRGLRFVQVLKRHSELYRAAKAMPRGARLPARLAPPVESELWSIGEPTPLITAALTAAARSADDDDADDTGADDGA